MTDITAKLAEALLPCPFCGGEAEIERMGDRRVSTIYRCCQCGCSLETGEEWSHGEQWNRRAALTAYTASQGTRDEETVERVRAAIAEGLYYGLPQVDAALVPDDLAASLTRAALSAIPARDEAALADLALDYLHLAQPEFCSARCPSVGREGEPIPHLPECISMRSLLGGLPFATPGATISSGLMAKLKKLANYLTEQGEYEACDLIDTVVDRLTAAPPAPAQEPRS